MTIRKIPSDTPYFHYHNENPKQNRAGDCVVRAIATATGETWETVYRELCDEGMKMRRMPNETKVYEAYLKKNGWRKMKQPRKSDNTRYTGCEFIDAYNLNNAIMHIGSHHVSCIVDGRVNDIWDCSEGCVGNYWVR